MSIVSTTKMTARQFLELGEDPPGVRLELVNGAVAVSPSPIPKHGYVITKLTKILANHIDEHDLGRLYPDVDTIFGEHDVRRPDLLFFSKRRLHLIGEKAMEGPPDLCIEVISPSSTTVDRRDKFKQYAKGGVKFYWIVDPGRRTMEGYKLDASSYRSTGKGKNSDTIRLPPFEDLDIPLGELGNREVSRRAQRFCHNRQVTCLIHRTRSFGAWFPLGSASSLTSRSSLNRARHERAKTSPSSGCDILIFRKIVQRLICTCLLFHDLHENVIGQP